MTVLAVALSIGIAAPAWAASPPASATSPKAVLETFFGRTNAILRSTDPELGIEGPRQAIRALVNEMFDYQDAAARALGPTWESKTPGQQAEFVRLFADFVERGYIGFVSSKVHVTNGLNVSYVEESVTGDAAAVATSLLTRTGSSLDVDYIMVRRGEGWMVRDVIVDGMSLVANYRSQFNRILATSSYADLVARMQGEALEMPQPVLTAAASAPVQPASASPQVNPDLVQAESGSPQLVSVPPQVDPDLVQAVSAPPQLASAAPQVDPELVQAVSAPPQLASAAPQVDPELVQAVSAPAVVSSGVTAPPAAAKELHVAARPRDEAAPKVEPIRMSAPEPMAVERVALTGAGRAGATHYWIQVGAFKTEGAAAQLAERLRRQGMTAWNDQLTSLPGHPERALARVRVGPFATHSDAQSKLRVLMARGYAPFIAEARD